MTDAWARMWSFWRAVCMYETHLLKLAAVADVLACLVGAGPQQWGGLAADEAAGATEEQKSNRTKGPEGNKQVDTRYSNGYIPGL